MALHHDPPVNDRLDQYDYDGDPGRLVPEPPCKFALEIDERSDLMRLSLHIGCASDGCDEMDCSTITENDYSDDGGCHIAPSWTSPVDSNMLPTLGSLPNMMQKSQLPTHAMTHDAGYPRRLAKDLTSPTELIEMSAATSTTVGRLEGDNTTHTEIDPLLTTTMAVTSTGWPYGAQPGCAAPHDTMENMFTQGSPLSELYESPDEMAWATYINEEMLAPSDFTMNYPCPTDTSSPEDIINDPTVQYDVEQSLFSFNDPLPDLSASSDYLSGDQLSASYFGSANTSPFEQSLDYIPDDMDFLQDPSSMPVWPLSSTSASPLPTSTTSPTSPDAADHPYRCTTDNCTKTFRKEAQLKQHQRVHRKSLVCTICRAERHTEHKFAQVRDLERHLQARHPEVAQTANVRSEIRECPHPGCDHRGRRDNVSRHHESKHGKKLKWKRGVPHVVG
ncbi:Zinc finger transcription factor ace1 [Colletotrichum fructicola]|nr:Zinc finger transcription factor ace1 [Colletotrichum fructicola]